MSSKFSLFFYAKWMPAPAEVNAEKFPLNARKSWGISCPHWTVLRASRHPYEYRGAYGVAAKQTGFSAVLQFREQALYFVGNWGFRTFESRCLSRSALVLLILLLLGFVLLFACHLFLNLFLILFSDFVSHYVTPFHCYLPFCPCHFPCFTRTIQSWVKVYARPSRSQRKKFALKRPKILGHIRQPGTILRGHRHY